MAKIKDIAKLANVSPSTVSRVFNGYDDIPETTKQRIFKIAAEHGYSPNVNAVSLVKQQARTLGIIYDVTSGFSNLFFSGILESFRRAAEENVYDILFLQHGLETGLDYVRHCNNRNIRSVFIITHSYRAEIIPVLKENGIHVVAFEPPENVGNSVASDHYLGIHQSCSELYHLGHRKIAFVQGSLTVFSGKERLRSYLDFCKNNALESIFIDQISNENYTVEEGYTLMNQILDQYGIPDAVCAAADLLALGAIHAMQNRNIDIPNQVSIIGFDDLILNDIIRPRLSTIKQDTQAIGRIAYEKLVSITASNEIEFDSVPVPTYYIQRESTKKKD